MSDDLNLYRRSRAPREDQKTYGWKIVRASPGKQLKLMVLSEDVFGIDTHYWERRTGPCREVDCPACLAGYDARWKGYVLAVDTSTHQNIVLEFTPPAFPAMDEGLKKYGSMRGMLISVGRAKATFNGTVQIVVRDRTIIPAGEYQVYGVWDVLAKIWKLKPFVRPRVSSPVDECIDRSLKIA